MNYKNFPDMYPPDTTPGCPPPNPRNIIGGSDTSGRFTVKFLYSAELIADIKSIPGIQWNPDGKNWVLRKPQQTADALMAMAAFSDRNGFGWARTAEKLFNQLLGD